VPAVLPVVVLDPPPPLPHALTTNASPAPTITAAAMDLARFVLTSPTTPER
jgi:hypothetical protein